MVHLNQNHAVSVQRTAALMQDFFGLSVGQTTVVKAGLDGAEILRSMCWPKHGRNECVCSSLFLPLFYRSIS